MIKLQLHNWYASEVDLWNWEPDSLDDIYCFVQLAIGARGHSRVELFSLLIATPEGLRANGNPPVFSNRSTLIVDHYSGWQIREEIEQIVQSCSAAEWMESIYRLQRYFRWEYEDYPSKIS